MRSTQLAEGSLADPSASGASDSPTFSGRRRWGLALVAVGLFALGACAILMVPTDPQPACAVSTTTIEGWFESGSITLDGVVKPADSVTFPNIPNCTFYEWTEQMFLWLTSPAPPRYGGGGGRIFNSPEFYDVSPLDTSGERTLIPHTSGGILKFSVRDAQVGFHGLPIVFDRAGQPFEVLPQVRAASGRPMVRNAKGETVEVFRAALTKDGRAEFRDEAGSLIQGARPILREELMNARIVQKFQLDAIDIFLGPSGNVINVDQGQAGGGNVLMAQNGSLVYYRTTVNNVFAYFLTGTKNGGISPAPTQFPTTQGELDDVLAFAAANGKTLIDPEALAIEVKSSWIEASSVLDPSQFITLQATIPTYDTSDPNLWIPNGQKTVTMAMVGMHVVGSTSGHPEMLWGTFEHVSSTPNAEYSYTNSGGGSTVVSQDTAGNWLFCANGSSGPFNVPHMSFDSGTGNIESVGGFTISPSDTIRWKAWGTAVPNPSSSSQVISINNSVRSALVTGDVRANYVQTGTTWTIGGAAPTGANQVGTNRLCNTTMETYDQGVSNGANGMNCFTCHGTNTTSVSHIFGPLQPLF